MENFQESNESLVEEKKSMTQNEEKMEESAGERDLPVDNTHSLEATFAKEAEKIVKLRATADAVNWELKERLKSLEATNDHQQQNLVKQQMKYEDLEIRLQNELRNRENLINKSHVCTECDAAFNRMGHLRGHMARLHGGPRPKKCPHCPKRFLLTCDLNPHIRKHTGEKPFICQVCQKGFKSSSWLSCHKRKHTGEKPYICNVCCVGFYTSGPLHLHMRKHFQMKAPTETSNVSVAKEEESSIVTKEPAEIMQEDSHFAIEVIDEWDFLKKEKNSWEEDKSIKP